MVVDSGQDPIELSMKNSFRIYLYTELGEEAAESGEYNEAEKYFRKASEEIQSQLEFLSDNPEEILESRETNKSDIEKYKEILNKQNQHIQTELDRL
jgi:hypothetical protein